MKLNNMKIKKNLKRNAVAEEFLLKLSSFSFGPVIVAIIGFFSVPIITRMVPPHLYGQLSMSTTVVSLAMLLLVLGLDQAYIRNYAGTDKPDSMWLTAFMPSFIFACIVSSVVFLFRDRISRILFGEYLLYPAIILSLTILSKLVEHFLYLRVRMQEAGSFYSVLAIIRKSVTVFVTIIWVLIEGPSLSALMFPVLFASLLNIFVITISPYGPRLKKMSLDTALIKPFLAFGLPLVLASAQMWILNSLDKIALRLWTDFTEIGIYTAAFRLVSPMLIIKSSFSMYWAPVRYRWRQEGVSLQRYQKVADAAAILMALIFIILLSLRWLAVLLLGPEYRDAVTIVPLAMVFPLMYTLSETTFIGVGFSGKTYWETVSTAVAAIANVFLNWLFVPHYGAFGAALATAISFIIFFWVRTLISNRLWEGLKIRVELISTIVIISSATFSIALSNWIADLIVTIVCASAAAIYVFIHRNRFFTSHEKEEL